MCVLQTVEFSISMFFFSSKIIRKKFVKAFTTTSQLHDWEKKPLEFAMKAQWIMNDIALLKTLHIARKAFELEKEQLCYPTYKLLRNKRTQCTIFLHRKIFWFTMFCSLLKLGFFLHVYYSAFCLSLALYFCIFGRRTCKWNTNCINNTHKLTHSDDAIHLLCIFGGRRLSVSVKTTWSKHQLRVLLKQRKSNRVREKETHTHMHMR